MTHRTLKALAVGLLAVLAMAGRARATNIMIDDLTDTITVTTDDGTPLTILPDTSGEFLHFTFAAFQLGTFGTFSRDLMEPLSDPDGGGSISDRLLVTVPKDGIIFDVQFASDPAALPPQGTTIFDSIDENGRFQTLITFQTSNPTGPRFVLQVRSDADPEPSSIALVGLGSVALIGVAARRRRTV
jgi:hypothetical protein